MPGKLQKEKRTKKKEMAEKLSGRFSEKREEWRGEDPADETARALLLLPRRKLWHVTCISGRSAAASFTLPLQLGNQNILLFRHHHAVRRFYRPGRLLDKSKTPHRRTQIGETFAPAADEKMHISAEVLSGPPCPD